MRMTQIAAAITCALSTMTAVQAENDGPMPRAASEVMNVHNRCIVRLNSDISKFDVEGRARGMVARAQARGHSQANLQHVYKHSIKGFTVNMSCADAHASFGDELGIMRMTPDSLS